MSNYYIKEPSIAGGAKARSLILIWNNNVAMNMLDIDKKFIDVYFCFDNKINNCRLTRLYGFSNHCKKA